MTTFIKIAWRNIVRNKYRSLITIAAVSFGLATLIFLRAFVDGADAQMIRNYTSLISGQIQIHKTGFQKKMGLERSLEDPEAIERRLAGVVPDMASDVALSGKVKNYVLASSAEQSTGLLLVGVDPDREKRVSDLYKHVRSGTFVTAGQDDQIVLGKDAAEVLNVSLGDKVVIMGQGADGSLASGAFRICGLLDTGTEEADKGLAIITLAAAQNLLVLDNKVSELTVHVGDVYKVEAVASAFRSALDQDVYEVLTWKEISPMLDQTLQFDQMFFDFILLIFMLIVAIGILNTILMGVLERIREFGILLALGTKRRQIVFVVACEAVFLGLLGMLVGVVLGVVVTVYFAHHGIDVSLFGKAFDGWYIGSVIHPRLFLRNIMLSSAIVVVTSIVVSVFPAWKAASLKPLEAIHHF